MLFFWIHRHRAFSIGTMFFTAAALSASQSWPFLVLAASVAVLILLIGRLRLHPFLALVFAALLAGVLADKPEWSVIQNDGSAKVLAHFTGALEMVSKGLGDTARDIALSIAFASIIGLALMESGAADKVVRRFLAFFGEKHAGWALMWSTYVLSIPIFFDTMFMLMVPLARALRLRTGKDYLLYILAVCCGGIITHSMTVPHPGPIKMVENLGINVGFSIIAGLLAGIIPAIIGYWACQWFNKQTPVPLREAPGTTLDELRQIVDKDERELPSFFWSILPVVLPIALITLSSVFKVIADESATAAPAAWAVSLKGMLGGAEGFPALRNTVDFIGHKNIALLIGTLIATGVLMRQRGWEMKKIESAMGPPLETAGMIILITSAGGAFGFMLRNAGVGDAVKAAAAGYSINLVLLSYVVALVIRIAQGSATVAMLTASAIMAPMLEGPLPCNKIYIFLAIGWAAMACSWMNDSGFWVVSRLGGITERELLKTFTLMLTIISVVGLAVTYIASIVFPLI